MTDMPRVSAYLQLLRQLASYHRLVSMGLVVGNIVSAVVEVVGLVLFGVGLLRITQGGAMPAGFWLTNIVGKAGSADLQVVTVVCAAVYVAKNALMVFLSFFFSSRRRHTR